MVVSSSWFWRIFGACAVALAAFLLVIPVLARVGAREAPAAGGTTATRVAFCPNCGRPITFASGLREAYQAIDLKPRNGTCDNLLRPPSEAQRVAFARVVTELRRSPNAELVKLVAVSQPTVTVREFAQAVADQDAGCFAKVNRRAGGWDQLQRHLTSALAQT